MIINLIKADNLDFILYFQIQRQFVAVVSYDQV